MSWWRSQKIAAALDTAENKWFERWAGILPPRSSDSESEELFAAELSADVTAEQSRWRATSALRARQRLMRAPEWGDETAELAEGLDALRRSGDHQSLRTAVAHLHQVGPLEAVSAAACKVPRDGWTHTSACANFEMLAHAGDVIDEPAASVLAESSLQLADGYPADFAQRVQPDFSVRFYALRAVRGLLAAASPDAHRATARFIANQDPMTLDMALCLNSVVGGLSFDYITGADRETLWAFAQQDHSRIGAETLAWFASNGYSQAQPNLIGRAVDGDHYALAAIGDVTTLDQAAAGRLLEYLAARTQDLVAAARGGIPTDERHGANLALLNLCFPDIARWDPVIELLLKSTVAPKEKHRVCSFIVSLPETLPEQVSSALAASIDAVAAAVPGFRGTHVGLSIAVGALDGDEADAAAAALACGSPREREDIAHLLGSQHCPSMRPILASLINDRHVSVRAGAAHAIGMLANTSPTEPVSQLARTLAQTDGTLMVASLLGGLRDSDAPLSDMGADIARQLAVHGSAAVRRSAARALR